MATSKKTALPAATQRAAGPASALRTGTVTAISSSGGVTVSVQGGSLPGLAYLDSYTPQVGDVVSLYAQDSSWLVLGVATKLGWQTTAPTNNFSVSGSIPVSFRLVPGGVQVYAKVASGATTASGTSIATLPVGFYNPGVAITQNMANISTLVNLWVDLASNGQLQVHGTWANGNVLLCNSIFPIDVV